MCSVRAPELGQGKPAHCRAEGGLQGHPRESQPLCSCGGPDPGQGGPGVHSGYGVSKAGHQQDALLRPGCPLADSPPGSGLQGGPCSPGALLRAALSWPCGTHSRVALQKASTRNNGGLVFSRNRLRVCSPHQLHRPAARARLPSSPSAQGEGPQTPTAHVDSWAQGQGISGVLRDPGRSTVLLGLGGKEAARWRTEPFTRALGRARQAFG